MEARRVVLRLTISRPLRARIDLELGGAQPLRLQPPPDTAACRVLSAGAHRHDRPHHHGATVW